MAERRLRGAIIGFGQVAEKAHAQNFIGHPAFEIVAVADETAPRLNAGRSVFPNARAYSSFEDLLRNENTLDFVDIATPPFLHASQALAALERGCHVLCEKPLTLDAGKFNAIRTEAAARNLAVFTVHNWAHSPQWLKVFELFSSGALARLRRVEIDVQRTRPAAGALALDWRRDAALAGGGILVDHGWHSLYLVHRLLGSRCRVEVERFHAPEPDGAEDEAAVILRFPAATARVHLTWRAALRSNTALLCGSEGAALELRDDHLTLSKGDKPQSFSFAEKLSAGSAHPGWFAAMLEDFKAAVAEPKSRGRNLDESAFCLKIIREVYGETGRSARTARSPRSAVSGAL